MKERREIGRCFGGEREGQLRKERERSEVERGFRVFEGRESEEEVEKEREVTWRKGEASSQVMVVDDEWLLLSQGSFAVVRVLRALSCFGSSGEDEEEETAAVAANRRKKR